MKPITQRNVDIPQLIGVETASKVTENPISWFRKNAWRLRGCKPIKCGKRIKYRADEFAAWIESGCPIDGR